MLRRFMILGLLVFLEMVVLMPSAACWAKKPGKHKKPAAGTATKTTTPQTPTAVTGSTSINVNVDLGKATGLKAEDVLRTSLVPYQHEAVPDFAWDQLLAEQRVGAVLIEPKSEVILPAKDLADLKVRMKELDPLVMKIVKANGRVILGFQAVPRWLSSRPNDSGSLMQNQSEKIWYSVPPTDYTGWGQVVAAFVTHFNKELDTHGAVSYLIGSEPENYWLGEEREFFKYYEYAVKGALEADPRARVGGITPSFHQHNKFNTTGNFTEGKRPLLQNWIQFCSASHLPIHFVTWHSYPAGSPIPINSTQWGQAARDIRSWLGTAGYRDVDLIVTDWPEWRTHPENDTEYKAAWVTTGMISLVRDGITGTHLVRDTAVNKQASPGSPGEGNGLFNKIGIVKPVYESYTQLSRMKGRVVQVDTGDEFVQGIAAVENESVSILFSNFIPADWLLPRNLFDPSVDPEAVAQDLQGTGMKKKDLENLLAEAVSGTLNVEKTSFAGPTKTFLRRLSEVGRGAAARRSTACVVNAAVQGIEPGSWHLEEFIVDATHANSYSRWKDIQAKLAPYYGKNDASAAASAAKIIQEFNREVGLKSSRSVTVNVTAGQATQLTTTMQPEAVHLLVLSK